MIVTITSFYLIWLGRIETQAPVTNRAQPDEPRIAAAFVRDELKAPDPKHSDWISIGSQFPSRLDFLARIASMLSSLVHGQKPDFVRIILDKLAALVVDNELCE